MNHANLKLFFKIVKFTGMDVEKKSHQLNRIDRNIAVDLRDTRRPADFNLVDRSVESAQPEVGMWLALPETEIVGLADAERFDLEARERRLEASRELLDQRARSPRTSM